jgi:hypothetical protein
MNWIEQQERILNIQQNSHREPMKSILCNFIYINQCQYIDKIVTEEISWESDKEFRIPSAKVLHMIQSKRFSTSNTKYIFKELSLFHVDLEPEHVQHFSTIDDANIDSQRFFRILPYIDDIVIPDSIFMFHTMNALYFLFQEVSLKQVSTIKSIFTPLKISNVTKPEILSGEHRLDDSLLDITKKNGQKRNITKNVRFSYSENKKHTKKMIP